MSLELCQFDFETETLIDGRYRPLRVLGEGATGAVVLVEDTTLGERRLALKLLLPHLVSSHSSLSRFRTETRITMSLSHPNIVQTFGMGRHKNSFYYLKMEYCDGVSLRSLLEKNPDGLPVSIAIGILRDVASALHYAHERGVIHRDLKPENIIITPDGNAQLLDFGLAQTFLPDSRVTGAGTILGTPSYMSPEQLDADILDRRCDIYSFGILAWELITGKRPFVADTLLAIAEAHLKEDIPCLSEDTAPAWLNELIQNCSKKKRIQRPDSMIEVFAILDTHSDRPASTFINRDLGDTRTGTAVFSWRKQLNIWCRKNLGRIAKWTGVFFFVLALPSPPHFNSSMRWRYATGVLWLEKRLDMRLDSARILVNTPLELQYPQSFFGPSKHLRRSRRATHPDLSPRLFFRPLLHAGYSPNFVDKKHGMPPLYFYLRNGQVDEVREFILEKADPNLVDVYGKRALDYAIEAPRNNAQLVEKLLRAGAKPNAHSFSVEPPLIRAIEFRKLKVIQNLLKYGNADPNIQDLSGQPALYRAIASQRYEILDLLIKYGADTSIPDRTGKDPLSFSREVPFLPQRQQTEELLQARMSRDNG